MPLIAGSMSSIGPSTDERWTMFYIFDQNAPCGSFALKETGDARWMIPSTPSTAPSNAPGCMYSCRYSFASVTSLDAILRAGLQTHKGYIGNDDVSDSLFV